jgi:sugar phosphate isomerase/epimerase
LEDRISKGFKAIEVITFENQLMHSLLSMQKLLQKYSNRLELVSIHTPSKLSISDIIHENRRKRALLYLKKAIMLAVNTNCKRITFHVFQDVLELGEINKMICLRSKATAKCVEAVRSLNSLCNDGATTLCLENVNTCAHRNCVRYRVFGASPNDLLQVIKEANSSFLKLCFDVAHAQNTCDFLIQNPQINKLFNTDKLTPSIFYDLIRDHVDLIHISDTKGVIAGKGTDNLPLGKGEINLKKVLSHILTNKPKCPLVLEIDERDVNNAINMARSKKFLLHIMSKMKL